LALAFISHFQTLCLTRIVFGIAQAGLAQFIAAWIEIFSPNKSKRAIKLHMLMVG